MPVSRQKGLVHGWVLVDIARFVWFRFGAEDLSVGTRTTSPRGRSLFDVAVHDVVLRAGTRCFDSLAKT